MLDEGDEAALGVAVAVDVALRHADGRVAGQQLHIAQRTAGLVHPPGGAGDEGATAGVGRAALEAEAAVGRGEPVADADGRHGGAALGADDGTDTVRHAAQGRQGRVQVRVQGDAAAAAVLGGAIQQLQHGADGAARRQHHVPGRLGDLAGAQAGLDRQQDHDAVAVGVAVGAAVRQQLRDVLIRQDLGLLARHGPSRNLLVFTYYS